MTDLPDADLTLRVLSLRYSSWSMRAWLVLTHAGVDFTTQTIELNNMRRQGDDHEGQSGLSSITRSMLAERRKLGSVVGLFPVLQVGNVAIHESLAICEYVADVYQPQLWPDDPLDRARARAVSCEMVGGFANVRGEMSCHLFGRVPNFVPSPSADQEIQRLFEIWTECLEHSGGPFLFGQLGIADMMYFPMLARLQTYGISLPDDACNYAERLLATSTVKQLMSVATDAPRVPVYDDFVRDLGGDPSAALPSS